MAQREPGPPAPSKTGRGPLPPLPEDRPRRARGSRRPNSAQAEKSRTQEVRPREILRALSLPPLQSEKSGRGSDRPERPERAVRKAAASTEPASARPQKKPSSSPRAFQAEMDEWKRRNGVPADSKVFSITGAFPGIRKALVARGWHENEDRQSQCWDLRYALWQRDLGEMNDLDDSQVVNYFARNAELTSKVGLCNSLYNCCTLDRVDVNTFYPRCYDLTTPAQAAHFVEDFKLTTCRCLLRRFVEQGGLCAPEGIPWKAYPPEAVRAALDVCRRQACAVDESLDQALEPAISEEEWSAVKLWSLKTPGKRLEAWGAPKAKATEAVPEACADDADLDEDSPPEQAQESGGTVDESLLAETILVLEELRKQLPQFGLDGHQNIWVLKPAGKSRGRGIQLSARLEKIQQLALGRGAEARWIAQKYIENPLVVNGKKFDIRQWVLVTRWSPLAAWFYQDCYVRFSFADYDPRKLKNKYAHLTNNSISKKAEGFEEERDDTMWHSDEFQEYLSGIGFERDGHPVEDPWLEVIQPAMKFAVLRSLEAAESLAGLSGELSSDPVSRDASAHASAQRADAEAALQAAAELAKPAAEAAKAAAEAAMDQEERLGNAGREEPKLPAPSQSLKDALGSVTPPLDPPEMLAGSEDLPAEALRTVSQQSFPPLPPPPWHPDDQDAQKPLEPGHRVVLRGLVDNPAFNDREGVIQRFDATRQVYEVRIDDGRQRQKPAFVKVGCHHVSRIEGSEQEPALSLALPYQEELSMSPMDNRASVTRTSRSSRHTRSTKSSQAETLESLHIQEDSLLAKILLPYCRQVDRRPICLMSFYSVAVLVPMAILIVFRGFALETDFSAFVKADGAAMRDRDAFLLAFGEKKDLNGRRLSEVESELTYTSEDEEEVFEEEIQKRRRLEEVFTTNDTFAAGRRLKSLFLRKEFELLYRAKSGSILSDKALQEVQKIETGMTSLPGFQHLCYNRITAENKRFLCNPGQSLTAFAFPTQTASDSGTVLFQVAWDGIGRDMLPTDAMLAYMKTAAGRGDVSRDSRRYFPKSFSYPAIGETVQEPPTATRTKYSFHLDVGVSGDAMSQVQAGIDQAKADWINLINKELLPYFQSVESFEVDFFYSSLEMDSIEINTTLMNDLLLAIGSILFVVFYLRIHTGTWLLSVSSFFIIFTSVPLAYVMTPAEKATIASFLSVFLITGIGCDVVFVFTDFWEQSKGRETDCRLMWMIVHAGESCLATSMTTALSFFANLASALQPLREFGMFMGLCVMFAFGLVLLLLPPLLVVAERRKENAIKARTVDISCGDKGSLSVVQQAPQAGGKAAASGKKKDSVMQGLLFTLAGGIAGCPRLILAITGLFFLTSVIGVVSNAKLSTGVPDIFPEWHNQVASKEVLENFATEAYLTQIPPAASSICVAHTANGTATGGCVLHWCEALQELSYDTTTTTTTGAGTEVFCRRSPTLRTSSDATGKQSLGHGFQACSIVNVYSRIAVATVVPTSAAWSRMIMQALEDEITPSSIEPRSVVATGLLPLVVENWETGEVNVLNFYQSSGTSAYPWPVQALNSSHVPCEMHVLCFEAGRFKCGISGWKELGTGSYQLAARRLDTEASLVPGRRLQTIGGLVPQAVSNALDVAVLWGIRSARATPLVGPPSEFWSYDPTFEPRNPWAQRAIKDMCTDLPQKLKIYRAKCWIIFFADFLASQRKRFPSRNFDEDVISWYYANTIEAQANLWFEDRRVIACKVQFWVNVPITVPSLEGLAYMELWNEFVDAKNAKASVTANRAWHTGSVWVRSEAETAIIGSTVDTIIIATCSGWAGVLLFTGDVMLAIIVTCVVIVVITGLAFFMVSVMGWSIGPIEVIALVVFVGYSVTYALHIAHNYNQMIASDNDLLEAEEKARKRQADRELAKAARKRASARQEDGEDVDAVELAVADGDREVLPEDLDAKQLRKARTRVAVLHVGGATLSSALSTAGSSAFLLFCTLTIFVKLGAVVVAVTVLSIVGAIVTLPAALMLLGPAPDAWYKRQFRRCKRMLTGGRSEEDQDRPLLQGGGSDEEGQIHMIS